MKLFLLIAVTALTASTALAQTPTPPRKPLIQFPDLNHQGSNEASTLIGGSKNNSLDDFIKKLEQIKLDDLKYSLALSKLNGNTITTPCWQALVDIFSKQNPAELKDDQGNVLTKPDPHIFVNIEIATEWLHQLQPDSGISLGCAPMAQAAQKDLASLIGAIVSGGAAGLFKLPIP